MLWAGFYWFKNGISYTIKLNQSLGPVIVLWPERGLSTLDCRGRPFWDPDADVALLKTLKRHIDARIPLIESDAYINDPEFAQAIFMAFEKIEKSFRAIHMHSEA